MNGLQAKLARVALSLSFDGAAKLCGVAVTTLQRVESDDGGKYKRYGVVKATTLRQIETAYTAAGIEFSADGRGIKLKA